MRHFSDDDDEDDLDEASLLESPLDKIEPYGLFKNVLMSMYSSPGRLPEGHS